MGRTKMRQTSRRAWSLSAHLLALCLAVLVPAIILGGLALWNLLAAERSSTELRLLQAVEDIASSVDREILGYTRVGETLAASPMLQSRDFSSFDLQARQMLGLHGWLVMLTDANGQQLVNTALPAGAPLPRSDVQRLRAVFETGKPRVTDLFFAAGKMPLVGVRVPVISAGRVAYVLTIAVPTEVLTPLLDQSIGELSWSLEIADRTGRVIARSAEHAENVGKMLPASALEQLKWRTPIDRTVSAGSQDVVRVLDRTSSGWIVAALVPASELAKISRRGWTTFTALAVALTALSIALAYLFARRIAQPIERLASIPVEGRADGIPETRLAEANQVGATLIESIRELEASEERYRTLVEAANDIIYTTDLQGRFLTCNAATYRTLGYGEGELIGQPLAGLIADGETSSKELLPGTVGDGQRREIQVTARSGQRLTWEVSSRQLRDSRGSSEAVLSIARDITGRKRAEKALRANEERLRLALAGIGAGVWEYDFATRSSMWSPEMMELYGMSVRSEPPSRAELLSMLHPDDRERIRVGAERQIENGGPFAAQFRVCRPDGRLVWISSRGVVELGPDGRALRARGIDQDVTAARNAELQREELLRTTAQQLNELQALYDSATIGLALLDRQFRFQRINSVLAGVTGLPVDAHLGKMVWDLMPEFRPIAEPLFHQVLSTGEPLTGVEITADTPAQPGTQRTWLLQCYPLKSPDDGSVIGIGVICEEVTEHQRAQLGQAHLAAIVESSADAIVSYSTDGRIRTWNPGAERMFGHTAAEAIGQSAGLLVPPDSGEPKLGFFDRARAGESLTAEARRRRKDGTDIPVSISASPMRDPSGLIVAVSGIFRDISEQKRREEHTRFIMRELSHRSKNLLAVIQAMARQTARTSRSLEDFQERFTARVKGLSQSHDLLVQRDWSGVPVAELVRAHVVPFVDRVEQALVLSGPSLSLKPEAAQNIGLALHELATNASKHGALSSPTGRIEIRWEIVQRNGERRFQMSWQESGGPEVAEPKQRGFGYSVVEAMVGRALEGEAHVEWRPKGLVWNLDVSASCVATGSDSSSERKAPPEGVAHELQALSHHWHTLSSRSGGLPRIDDIDVDAIPGAEWAFVAAVERHDQSAQFRFLRVGEKLADLFGRPDTGEPLLKGGRQVLGSLRDCHSQAVVTGRPCHDWVRISLDSDGPLEFERLLLPFSEDGEAISHFLGMAIVSNAA